MRNKWYVIGLLVPTVLLGWWAVSLAMGDSGWLFIVPGALAVGLGIAAVRVARAASFAPSSQSRWNTDVQTAGMSRWLRHRADDAADAQAAKDAEARAERRPPATP